MKCKGPLSLVMMIAIGTVGVITSSMAGHSVDLDGTNAMEELALIMAAAAENKTVAH